MIGGRRVQYRRMNPYPNAGAQQLATAGTISELAKRLNVADRTIAGWRGGRVPSEASRASIERELGIARSAWDRRVEASSAPTGDAPSALAAPQVSPTKEPLESAERRLRAQLVRLREQRAAPNLSPRDVLEIEKLELAASRALDRQEGLEISEKRIFHSAAWKRIEAVIVRALEPWPDAMRALASALEALDARAA